MDQLHSDDLIVSEDESPNPFAKQGAKLISEMLAFAHEDRLTSKRTVLRLKDVRGVNTTVKTRQRWWNLFRSFVIHIRQEDINQTPSGDTFERFFAQIINRMKSNIIGKQVISRNTFKQGMHSLASALNFQYSDFKLTTHHLARLDALVSEFTKSGQLYVGTWTKRQFIGFLTLRKLLTSWVSDGLTNGVRSWDTHISRMLCLVLQSSMDSRSGEVARSREYTGDEYLKWSDIVFVMPPDKAAATFQDIQVELTIRWEKGDKDDPTSFRKVYFKPLNDPLNVVLDPVVLLLVLALRTGQTPGNTLEEILQTMNDHAHGKLEWNNPDLPVICAIDRHDDLILDKPARVSQASDSARHVGHVAGMFHRLHTHDLRRGSGKDLRHLKKVDAGPSLHVADALGHKATSFFQGTTAKYTERTSYFLPNAKEEGLEEYRFENPIALERPKKLARKTKSAMLEDIRREDPTLKRDQVYTRLENKLEDTWREEQSALVPNARKFRKLNGKSILDQRSESENNIIKAAVQTKYTQGNSHPPSIRGPSNLHTRATDLQKDPVECHSIDPRLLENEPLSLTHAAAKPVSSNKRELENNSQQPLSSKDSEQFDEEEDESVLYIDDASANALLEVIATQPELHDDAQNLEPTTEEETAPDQQLNEEEEGLFLDAIDPFQTQYSDSYNCYGPQFIKTFAQINTIRFNQWKVDSEFFLVRRRCSGHSRDLPSQFIRLCKYTTSGCEYKHHAAKMVSLHEIDCVYQSEDRLRLHLQVEAFRETRPTPECSICGMTFTTKCHLTIHLTNQHPQAGTEEFEYTPKPCDLGCTSTRVFSTLARYNDHVLNYHPQNTAFEPKECELKSECRYETVFISRKQYRRHLKSIHSLDKSTRLEMVPDGRTKSKSEINQFIPVPCPIGNCSWSFRKFISRCKLADHLMGPNHMIPKKDAYEMAGWGDCDTSDEESSEEDTTSATSAQYQPFDCDTSATGFRCPVPHCERHEKPYKGRTTLREHLGSVKHGFSVSETYRLSGMTLPDKIDSTNYQPIASDTSATGFRCPVPDCKQHEHRFKNRAALGHHLRTKKHNFSLPEAYRLSGLTPRDDAKLLAKDFMCPIGDCNHTKKGFTRRNGLKIHLMQVHACSEEKAVELSGIDKEKRDIQIGTNAKSKPYVSMSDDED